MQISLTPEQEIIVQSKLAQGTCSSPNEVVAEAFQLLQEKEFIHQLRIINLNKDIEKGLNSVALGNVFSAEEVLQHMKLRRESFRANND